MSAKKGKRFSDTMPVQKKKAKKYAKKATKLAYRVAKSGVSAQTERLTYDINGSVPITMDSAVNGTVADAANNFLAYGANLAATMICINQVARDASASGRIGRHFLMKSVHIRAHFNAQNSDVVALLLVEVRNQQQGPAITLPAVTDILNVQNCDSLTRIDNASRFRIVRRWLRVLDPASMHFAALDELVPLNVLTSFTQADSTGSFRNMTNGALLLVAVGNRGSGDGPTAVRLNTRIYYTDQ